MEKIRPPPEGGIMGYRQKHPYIMQIIYIISYKMEKWWKERRK